MKKLGILGLAALLVVAFTIPASALESQFGGYWRTRFFTQQNFSGEDQTEAQDWTGVDTRTRLYYTAIFHENLKFVVKLEWNTDWGDDNGGDIGSDGTGHIRVKNAYADFNTGPVNWKVGQQGIQLARGFLFDDDFSGMVINYKGETFQVPFIWMHANEGFTGLDANDLDVDYYGLAPKFDLGMFSLNPYFLYVYSKDSSDFTGSALFEEMNIWYLGLDADVDFGMGSAWGTFIYQGGDQDLLVGDSIDYKAWLAAIGGNVNFGMFDVHGEFFYATGEDGEGDDDFEQFWVPAGQSYYWSEIMGLGIFDQQKSNNAPGDKIGNVWAANLGSTVKPMDKLSITLDLWYASLVEQTAFGLTDDDDKDLGFEADLIITYELVQNLNLDVVGAYLWAGDATTLNQDNDANPYEIGARLSLSF